MKKLNFYSWLIFTILLVPACSFFGYNRGVEIVNYEIIKSDKPFEIRLYPIINTVTIKSENYADLYGKRRDPFMKLFDYISGENKSNIKIEMTSPVIINPISNESEKSWSMSFVLPSNYEKIDPPIPLDPQMKIGSTKNTLFAVVRMNGILDKEKAHQKRKELENWIKENNYNSKRNFLLAYYNPPWTLPFARRNEVFIEIEKY